MPRQRCIAACWPTERCWWCWTTPATANQVRPLLPGSSACRVVITSRNQLASLVTQEGARPITLDVLSVEEAAALLAGRLGQDRVAAEPDS